jgi:PilZ domain-containing protein
MHMSYENEHRKHRRQRVLKEGKIVSSDMNSLIDVKIRDMSTSGALVNLPANVVMPDKFNLLIVSERLLYPAELRWRKGEAMGLEFTGEPRPSALRIGKPR